MGANTQGRERLLLFKDEVSVAVLPVENEMRKLPALIQSCKLENTLWSRIAVPSVWEKSKYKIQYSGSVCILAHFGFFAGWQDWHVWAWHSSWLVNSVFQMLLLEQPSLSSECVSRESVLLMISHVCGLNCCPEMWNSKNCEEIMRKIVK